MTHGCSPSLEDSSKFQTSQGYIERPCLKKKKKKDRRKEGRMDGSGYRGKDRDGEAGKKK